MDPHQIFIGFIRLLAVLAFVGNLSAEPFVLAPRMTAAGTTTGVTVYEDVDGVLEKDKVLTGAEDGKFHPLDKAHASEKISSSVWWVRFEAINPTTSAIQWVLRHPFPHTDLVDIHHQVSGETIESFSLGDTRPRANRPLASQDFAVPLLTPPGEKSVVYMRLQNLGGDRLSTFFQVSSFDSYIAKQQTAWIFSGLILGGGLVTFLYNAFVYLFVRERLYVWYLLYLVFILTVYLAVSGMGAMFLWPGIGALGQAIPPLASSLAFACVIQFSREFLGTRRKLPRIDIALRGFLIYLLVPPLAFFLGYPGGAALAVMVALLAMIALPIISSVLWVKGNRSAMIFTLAWGVWSISAGTLAAQALGFIPTGTLPIGWLGILGEAVLFAMALGDRVRILRTDKEAAEAREREALLGAKQELTAQVEARTRELAGRNAELQLLNSEKDKFFSIIAHDLRGPLGNLTGLTEWMSAEIKTMSREEIESCLRDLNDSASTLHSLLENLLSWALLQRGLFKFRPESVELRPLCEQCSRLLAPTAADKNIVINISVPDGDFVVADRRMLETILRNLLGNALKYSRPGDQITLVTRTEGDAVEISVADEGVGMDAGKLERLFDLGERTSTPGTQGEHGTGLGLQLCKEFVEAHGSRLTVESVVDRGTVFRFSLKLVAP